MVIFYFLLASLVFSRVLITIFWSELKKNRFSGSIFSNQFNRFLIIDFFPIDFFQIFFYILFENLKKCSSKIFKLILFTDCEIIWIFQNNWLFGKYNFFWSISLQLSFLFFLRSQLNSLKSGRTDLFNYLLFLRFILSKINSSGSAQLFTHNFDILYYFFNI